MSAVVDAPKLRDRLAVFADRADAGRVLATLLEDLRGTDALILGIPAGGVPVAHALAHALDLPLGVAVVSKLTLPWNTEVGYGAVAFDGTLELNEELIHRVKLAEEEVAAGREVTAKKVARRVQRFGGVPDVAGRTVVLVDDGLASGFTMRVAIEAVRHCGAREVIVAAPTAPESTAEEMAADVDRLVVANLRGGWSFAVAAAYRDWYDVTEAEVLDLLGRSSTPEAGASPRS